MIQQSEKGGGRIERGEKKEETSLLGGLEEFVDEAKETFDKAKDSVADWFGLEEGGLDDVREMARETWEEVKIKRRRKGTIGAILSVIGAGTLGTLKIAENVVKGKYSFKDLLQSWRNQRLQGIRKYLVDKEVPSPEGEEAETDEGDALTEQAEEAESTDSTEHAEASTEVPSREEEEEVAKDSSQESSERKRKEQQEQVKRAEGIAQLTQSVFDSIILEDEPVEGVQMARLNNAEITEDIELMPGTIIKFEAGTEIMGGVSHREFAESLTVYSEPDQNSTPVEVRGDIELLRGRGTGTITEDAYLICTEALTIPEGIKITGSILAYREEKIKRGIA